MCCSRSCAVMPVLILRSADAEKVPQTRTCVRASRRMRTGITAHDLEQHTLPPSRGACLRPGFCTFASLTPSRGVGGAPRNVRVLSGTPVGRIMTRYARRLARRLAAHNAGRSPLGAPPWRFFTRGRASVSGIASGYVQRAPRSQVIVPGGRLPGPPGASDYEPVAPIEHIPSSRAQFTHPRRAQRGGATMALQGRAS